MPVRNSIVSRNIEVPADNSLGSCYAHHIAQWIQCSY
jgi:hypothetical protein